MIDWQGNEAPWIINQSCVSVCLANSSSFHVINVPCWLLDQQTHCSVRILLEHHHKTVHLALCTDDSTYQVKHGIVKLCGPKSGLYGGKALDALRLCLFFLRLYLQVCQQLYGGAALLTVPGIRLISFCHSLFWLIGCPPPHLPQCFMV